MAAGIRKSKSQILKSKNMKISTIIPSLFIYFLVSANVACSQGTLVGGPCEGCEAIYEYGDRSLSATDTLPGFEEAAEKLKVTGVIYQSDGETPAEGVIFYIYHTNDEGVYPTRGDETGWGRRHGYIRGWIQTDADGKYTFYTSKPGSYSRNPAHIHPTILEPNGKYYYIDEYLFKGDQNLRGHSGSGRGGSGVVELKKDDDILVAERDIILGLNVPGYE
jgi:protocatechuate 3,4-dioxygenase beta subunit